MKGLTWVDKSQLGWKFNLKVLSEKIENIGEELEGFAYFTNPTLFLRGENSNYITLDDIDSIEEIFPMAQYSTIENSGHWMHAENPEGAVIIQADKKAFTETLVTVMDSARQAGVYNVSIAANEGE